MWGQGVWLMESEEECIPSVPAVRIVGGLCVCVYACACLQFSAHFLRLRATEGSFMLNFHDF